MFKLIYFYERRIAEEYIFPNERLCHWKINEFRKAGTHIYGHFVIEKI